MLFQHFIMCTSLNIGFFSHFQHTELFISAKNLSFSKLTKWIFFLFRKQTNVGTNPPPLKIFSLSYTDQSQNTSFSTSQLKYQNSESQITHFLLFLPKNSLRNPSLPSQWSFSLRHTLTPSVCAFFSQQALGKCNSGLTFPTFHHALLGSGGVRVSKTSQVYCLQLFVGKQNECVKTIQHKLLQCILVQNKRSLEASCLI